MIALLDYIPLCNHKHSAVLLMAMCLYYLQYNACYDIKKVSTMCMHVHMYMHNTVYCRLFTILFLL